MLSNDYTALLTAAVVGLVTVAAWYLLTRHRPTQAPQPRDTHALREQRQQFLEALAKPARQEQSEAAEEEQPGEKRPGDASSQRQAHEGIPPGEQGQKRQQDVRLTPPGTRRQAMRNNGRATAWMVENACLESVDVVQRC